ncbi:MBL fold metallo-hydrolase [Marinicella sp. W31]|uniref:MBL fold metallo-hydrolase n=1 Tax=Marinicella sp. W31 TaxID=3023713 RepID=UPI003756A75E
MKLIGVMLAMLISTHQVFGKSCDAQGAWLQILGAGGPELNDGFASSGYLLWQDGRARILVDTGSGSLAQMEKAGADINDIEYILYSHLHVDHSADLPAFIKATYFTNRSKDLQIYGPTGNKLMPATTEFVTGLFGQKGVYRYLNNYLNGSGSYQIKPHNVDISVTKPQPIIQHNDLAIQAISVHHGPLPALAWRIDMGEASVVFSGDTSNKTQVLQTFANKASVLVAHHAIPEAAGEGAKKLHMPPSEIGRIAVQSNVEHVVLSHRMTRSLAARAPSKKEIRKNYKGQLTFAKDNQCIAIGAYSDKQQLKESVPESFNW